MVIDISGARTCLIRRLQRPHQEDGERGSLILDILIGMAIFALIAIIAVSAIGQYRERAYVQTAVSDAEATANAINAHITDNAADGGGFPTGILDDADFDALGVTPTEGAGPSHIVVLPNANMEDFGVCVEHKGAYAFYDTASGGLQESGSIEKDDFIGCDVLVGGGNEDDGTNEGTPETPIAVECNPTPWDQSSNPGVSRVFAEPATEYMLPWDLGLTQEEWAAAGGNWWHEGEPNRFSVNQGTGDVLRDGAVFRSGPRAIPQGQVQKLPWEVGYTKASWNEYMGTATDWWHDGNLAAYSTTADGYVLKNCEYETVTLN